MDREALLHTPSLDLSAGRGLSSSSRLRSQAEAPGGPQQHSFCILCVWCVVQLFATPPTGLLYAWESPGKNTEVGCHALLQEIFPTQESNPHLLCLLHGKCILDPWNHRGSPFCILVVLKFTKTTLFGAPWNCATLWPLMRRVNPQLPSSQPPPQTLTSSVLLVAGFPLASQCPQPPLLLGFAWHYLLLERLPCPVISPPGHHSIRYWR